MLPKLSPLSWYSRLIPAETILPPPIGLRVEILDWLLASPGRGPYTQKSERRDTSHVRTGDPKTHGGRRSTLGGGSRPPHPPCQRSLRGLLGPAGRLRRSGGDAGGCGGPGGRRRDRGQSGSSASRRRLFEPRP